MAFTLSCLSYASLLYDPNALNLQLIASSFALESNRQWNQKESSTVASFAIRLVNRQTKIHSEGSVSMDWESVAMSLFQRCVPLIRTVQLLVEYAMKERNTEMPTTQNFVRAIDVWSSDTISIHLQDINTNQIIVVTLWMNVDNQ